jgi:hypothetical protein
MVCLIFPSTFVLCDRFWPARSTGTSSPSTRSYLAPTVCCATLRTAAGSLTQRIPSGKTARTVGKPCHNVTIMSPRSFHNRVEYASSTAMKMSIDRRTAVNLELISNARRYALAPKVSPLSLTYYDLICSSQRESERESVWSHRPHQNRRRRSVASEQHPSSLHRCVQTMCLVLVFPLATNKGRHCFLDIPTITTRLDTVELFLR